MKRNLLLITLLLLGYYAAFADTEPNDAIGTANILAYNTNINGKIGSCTGTDNDDYYLCQLPAGVKSIRLKYEGRTTQVNTTGSVIYYIYDKFGNLLTNKTFNVDNILKVDSLDYTCYEGDIFYVRVYNYTGTCKEYKFKYEDTHLFTVKNDKEFNDDFTTALTLPYNKDTTGHLGSLKYSTSSTTDNDDYYLCELPAGIKSIRLKYSGRMAQKSTTGSTIFYVYDKFKNLLTSKTFNMADTFRTDSLDYTCYEGDVFYVRVYNYTGYCKEYKFKYEDTYLYTLKNDKEFNDDFATSHTLPYNRDTTGHLGSLKYSSNSTTDNDDYYLCELPAGIKSIRLKYSGRMAQQGNTGSTIFYVYDKFKNLLTSKTFNMADTFRTDSLDYTCYEGDTFYVRVYNYTGYCKEYKFKYEDTYLYTLKNDKESNDDFATAHTLPYNRDTTGHLGSLKYSSTGTIDNDDYYLCELPAGIKSIRVKYSGRMAQEGNTGSTIFYVYDKFKNLLTSKTFNMADTFRTDSLDYTCYEGDTFYVRVYNYTGYCKEYKLKYEDTYLYTLKNDKESNDDFATALTLPYNTDTTGHLASIKYSPNRITDHNDYYLCTLPADINSIRLKYSGRMAQEGTTGSTIFYVYDKFKNLLTSKTFNMADTFRTDSLDYTCYEGDTFYVRVYDYTGYCKEYKVKYEDTYLFSLGNDTAANETFVTATPIPMNTDTSGHLGLLAYNAGGGFNDGDDYYICTLPAAFHGLYLATASRTVQQGATGSIIYYVYNKNQNIILSKTVSLNNTLKRDTLRLDCFVGDTFYVRVYNYTGTCKEYTLNYTNSTLGVANAQFEKIRFGNSFSFTNKSTHSEKYTWAFGDGNTDTVAYPTHEYGIGQHIVSLKVENSCGSHIQTDTITVDGVEYYSPTKAGTEIGMGFFTLRIFGAGFDNNTVVTLTKDGKTITPFKKLSPTTKELNALFDLKEIPAGFYDVHIEMGAGEKYDYPKGLEIFVQEKSPNQIYTDISGPSRIRTGSWTNYTVNITNKKNRIANGVMAFIVVPKGMETNIKDILRKQSGKLTVKGSDYNQLSIDRDAYNTVYYDGTFNPNTDIIEVDYDALYKHFDEMLSYDITSLYGEPVDGAVYPLYIPFVNANSTYTLSFKIKSGSNGNYDVRSYVWPFTMRDNPMSGEALDFVHDAGMNAALVAEMSPHPALKAVGKSAGYVDIGSQVVFAEAFDWWYGTNVADEAFYGRQSLALAGEVAGELSPYGNKYEGAVDKINSSKRQLQRRTENINSLEEIILNGATSPTMAKRLREELDVLKKALDEAGDNLSVAEKEALINALKQTLLKKGLNYGSDELKDLLFPEEIKKTRVNSVTSLDPNAIYGNSGYEENRYIKNSETMNYLVTFENVDTAKAPAAIVKVDLQLDPAKFDITKTLLGNVTIAGKTYLVEEDRKEYFRDIDLRPGNDVIVRVNAKADTVTGNLHWEFISLDPQTMDVISDPDKGFLPPNVTMPQGEGSVAFTAVLKQNLVNNDTVSPYAAIYFDANEPILTNNWKNTIDKKEPTSVINPVITITDDSLMNLTLSGTDGESGFEAYYLYVKMDDSAWSANPIPITKYMETKLPGNTGHTYSFYVEGKDYTGNREKKNKLAEATITIPVPEIKDTTKPEDSTVSDISLYPNPVRDELTITGIQENSNVEIFNSAGQSVHASVSGPDKYIISVKGLSSGNYIVKIIEPGGKKTTRKIVKR